MSSRKKVACLLDTPIRGVPNACEYIRLILPLTLKSVVSEFDVRFLRLAELHAWPADAVVVQRTAVASDPAFEQLMASVRAHGSRLIYEIDDDLPALGSDHPEHQHYLEFRPHILRMVGVADDVWVSTSALAAKFAPLNSSIGVLQNYLDDRLWRMIGDVSSAEPVRLLYFGSSSHSGDFAQIVKPAFAEVRAKWGQRVELTLIGVAAADATDDGITVTNVPIDAARSYPAFVTWLRSQNPFHVGLAPLLPSEFNRSKSHIKWLEYAALGAVTVASDVGEYAVSIEDGRTGILCAPDPKALTRTLLNLLENSDSLAAIRGNVMSVAEDSIGQGAMHDQRSARLRRLLY